MVIYFALGALWYSPVLFAKAWQRSIGWDPEQRPPEMRPTWSWKRSEACLRIEIGGGTLEAHQKNITRDLTRR